MRRGYRLLFYTFQNRQIISCEQQWSLRNTEDSYETLGTAAGGCIEAGTVPTLPAVETMVAARRQIQRHEGRQTLAAVSESPVKSADAARCAAITSYSFYPFTPFYRLSKS